MLDNEEQRLRGVLQVRDQTIASLEVVRRLIELVRNTTAMLYGKASATLYLQGFGIVDTNEGGTK